MKVETEEAPVLTELRRTIADILDVPYQTVTNDATFVEDLGVDSLMALEIMVALEKKYHIKLPEADLPRMTCLRAVYDVVTEKRGHA